MISFILSALGIAALIAVSFTVGCVAGVAVAVDKLAEGDNQKKLEICEKLKNNTH